MYSESAPGYHARAYGVYDALGLPRRIEKSEATRFEKRRVEAPVRLRIAEEVEEMPIEEAETELMKK